MNTNTAHQHRTSKPSARKHRFLSMMDRAIIRYAMVGLTATAIHLGLALILRKGCHFPEVLASFMGFSVALCVSYLGHGLWSFKLPELNHRHLAKFLTVALASWAFSSLILVLLNDLHGLNDVSRLVISVGVMPLFSFLINKCWTFNHKAVAFITQPFTYAEEDVSALTPRVQTPEFQPE